MDQDEVSGADRAARALRGVNAVTRLPDRAVFSLLGRFVPDTSVIRDLRFQHLLGAKFLADAGRDSVRYAALVGVVQNGGSPMASSLIGLASVIPGIIFALYGGAIADSLPKRAALGIAYTTDAALCIILPLFFGNDVWVMFMLVFMVTSLTQIASPAEQTLVPLVTSEKQLASANSIMGMVSSIGTAVGTAFLSPILLKAFGQNAVFFTAAVMLLLAMTRILQVSAEGDISKPKFAKPKGNFRSALRWLQRNRSIATMIAVSAIGGVGYTIVSTLAPNYVSEVLNTDPANTVYVMGSAGVGMTLSLFVVPSLIRWRGERVTAGIGFVLLVLGLVGLGLINSGVIDFLNYINPIYWLDEWIDLTEAGINDKIELAMFVAFPVGMGMGLTDNSVKTYLNRRVPVVNQGRTFAVRNLAESFLTVIPLLAVSAVATVVGVSVVLAITPIFLYGIAVALLRFSRALDDEAEEDAPRVGPLKTFWSDPDTGEVTLMEEDDAEPASVGAASEAPAGPEGPSSDASSGGAKDS